MSAHQGGSGQRKAQNKPNRTGDSESAPSVCLLITDLDAKTGGIQRQSFRLLEELGSRGVRTFVCARNYHRQPRNEIRGTLTIHRSPAVGRSLRAVNSLLYLADALWWLIRHRDEYDVLHCQQMFGSAMLGLLARRLLGKPVLVRVTSTGDLGEVRQVQEMVFAGVRLRQLRQVDRWVALTPDMRREIMTLGISAEKISVIPNATQLPCQVAYDLDARRAARERLGISSEHVAVYSGRLSSEKGLDVLLRAWVRVRREHAQAELFLLGAGGEYRNIEADLRALSQALGLEGVVHFRGHVSNVGDFLTASNVFVLPTRTEGMSNALVEAMASGTAVVTTEIPANRGLVDPEQTGVLVPVDEPEALAAAICRILSDPGLARSLGRNARDKAEQDLSIGAVASRYLEEYANLSQRALE